MMSTTGGNENLAPKVVREIAKELKALHEAPPEGIRISANEDNLTACCILLGSFCPLYPPCTRLGTPYEGGLFRMKLMLGTDFPHVPPKGFFTTRIFHPNVAKNGEICVNVLKKDWKPTLGVRHVLVVVRCLLIEPFAESALNEEAGKMLMEDYEGYAKHARLMTNIHAMKVRTKTTGEHGHHQGGGGCHSLTSSAFSPLAVNSANSDSPYPGSVGNPSNVATIDQLSGGHVTSHKKPKDESGVKLQVDKRKVDIRKKSLKRL
eukprot:jgi/Mesen1/7304/ME000374S06670